jgi:colicin import membrane protein
MNDSHANAATASGSGAATTDSSSAQISVSNRRKTMELVGFKMQQNGSRVFVRTNEPVRYSVSKGGNGTVVVELENTKIELANNERALDSSFFEPNAVAMIEAKPGATKTVRIQIKLKEQVPYETSQQGNEVYIDFQRPARK